MREAALVAPIAGIVGKRHAVPGEKVSAEQPLSHRRRPGDARARRHRRHARGVAARAGPGGAGARRGPGRAGDRAASTASRRPPRPARAPSAWSS
jgi:hypothetical protein